MPINVYTGLMGSGKSYEVVAEVIVPAIAQGRRVVTNVDGISNALIRAHVAAAYKLEEQALGEVRHVTNEDVFKPDFFPYYDNKKDAHTNTLVQPGDLVVVDEAWRFWPATGAKLLAEHKSFFLEHRHFTHADTDVACDLVLMIQDMGTLNRFIKNVVAFNARTHKKISLGLNNTYSITLFEGSKQNQGAKISTTIRKYKKEIFPLYSSFKGGAAGKTVNVDKRQNMLNNKVLWLMAPLVIVVGVVGVIFVNRFFHPKKADTAAASTSGASPNTATAGAKAAAQTPAPAKPASSFSDAWRLVGTINYGNAHYVVIADAAGRLRYESPSMFVQAGPQTIGDIDGAKVTYYSGAVPMPSRSSKEFIK